MSIEHCEYQREISSNVAYQCLIAFKFVNCLIGAIGICYQWRNQVNISSRFKQKWSYSGSEISRAWEHENLFQILLFIKFSYCNIFRLQLLGRTYTVPPRITYLRSEPTIQAPLCLLLGGLPNHFAYKVMRVFEPADNSYLLGGSQSALSFRLMCSLHLSPWNGCIPHYIQHISRKTQTKNCLVSHLYW